MNPVSIQINIVYIDVSRKCECTIILGAKLEAIHSHPTRGFDL